MAWYSDFLSAALNWMLPAALIETGLISYTRDRKGIVVLSFPVCYFIFINFYTVHFENTILPVIPFVILLASRLCERLYQFVVSRWRVENSVLTTAYAVGAIALALPFFRASAEYNTSILRSDARETARVWIEQNLPPGSRVFVEPYGPYIDSNRFVVEGAGATDHPLEWYLQNGFEYIVFSYGTYGRFFENRSLYSDFVNRYDEFFTRFSQVAQFNEGGFEIKIYKTGVTNLPSNQVSARFGIYSNWLEFVGYDLKPPVGRQPINMTFYWRILERRREALTLTVRLLDRNNLEVAQSSGALLGSQDSPQGIVPVPWSIKTPAEPGMYRLELDVDAQGQGRIPVLSRTYEKISDKLFVGSFKVSPGLVPAAELAGAHVVNVRFGDAITLLGYSVSNRAVGACENLETRLYWTSSTHVDKDYTVFIHLLDSTGKVAAQLDVQPRGGAYPTSLWDAGEIIRDDYSLTLRCDLAPGDYRVELGLYEYPNLARLGVTSVDGKDLGDHLILDDAMQVTR